MCSAGHQKKAKGHFDRNVYEYNKDEDKSPNTLSDRKKMFDVYHL